MANRPIWDEQDFAQFQERRAQQPPAPRGGQRDRGDLEVLEERVMAAIPRGDEELRVTFTRARTGNGKEVAWHSIRVFWKNDQGEWKPGKQGITIRARELHGVTVALLRACASSIPAELHGAAKAIVEALSR